jgi:hypothetical protein
LANPCRGQPLIVTNPILPLYRFEPSMG